MSDRNRDRESLLREMIKYNDQGTVDTGWLLSLLDVVEAARRFDYTPDSVPNQDEQGGCVFCGCDGGKAGMYTTKREDHAQTCEWLVLHDRFAALDKEAKR